MSRHGDGFASAERAYLEPPEEQFPPGVEDALGSAILWPEPDEDEDAERVEIGEVVDYEADDNGPDEDGRGWVVVTLSVKNYATGETCTLDMDRIDEWEITDPKVKQAAAEYQEADRLEQRAKVERARADNLLRSAYAA